MTDEDLLRAVNDPSKNDPLQIHSRTGRLVDGNGRALELLKRAADPASSITPDTEVFYEVYDGFIPWDFGL